MAQNTFYGGRPGQDFAIKATFATVDEMNAAFDLGVDYRGVWYGEYCLIAAKNRNSLDNGKLFKRGANGAEYIGQFAGPQSGSPVIEFVEETDDIKLTDGILDDDFVHFQGEDKNSHYGFWKDLDYKKIAVNKSSVGSVLKSGKDCNELEYKYITVSKEVGGEAQSILKIAASIPYPVFEFSAASKEPYDKYDNVDTKIVFEEKDDSKNKPFYYHMDVQVPHGIHGDDIVKVELVDVSDLTSSEQVYKFDNKNNLQVYDVSSKDKIFVAEIRRYSEDGAGAGGKSYRIYVGDYDAPKSFSYDTGTGEIKYTPYNTINAKSIGAVPFIKSASVDTEGQLSFKLTTDKDIKAGVIDSIEAIYTDPETHHLLVLHRDRNNQISAPGYVKPNVPKGSSLGNDYPYNVFWQDMGSIKDESGLLIGGDIAVKDPSNKEEVVKVLKSTYPKGGNDGKIVTVSGEDDAVAKTVWAFDYNLDENGEMKGWYPIGTIATSASSGFVTQNSDGSYSGGASLEEGAFAFVKKSVDMLTSFVIDDIVPKEG